MRLSYSQAGLTLFAPTTAAPPTPPATPSGPFVPADLSVPQNNRVAAQRVQSGITFQRNLALLTPVVIPVTGAIKTYSGHWIYIDQGQSKDAQFARTQALVNAAPEIVGYQYFWKWANLENPNVPGDYSGNWAAAGTAGFQLVHKFADYLRSVGKKMHLNNFSYGGNVGAPNSAGTTFLASEMPAYMAGSPTSPYGPNTAATNGVNGGMWQNCYPQTFSQVRSFMRFWEPAVGARMLALSQAYGAEFDSHAGFGMFSHISESTLPTQMPTYSVGADKTFHLGANGAFAKMRQHWPTTPLRWWGNFFGSRQDMSDMINAVVANKWICSGPDLLNDYTDSSLPGWSPPWSSTTAYRFAQIVTSGSFSYFSTRANTNSQPTQSGGVSTNANWQLLGTGTRNIDSDWVWQGKDPSGVVNPVYTNWVNRGAFGHDVEPLDLDQSHDDGVNFHHVMHANKTGAFALFWYDLQYNSSNTTPTWNRTNTPSPNLIDWIRSCALGGNVSINGTVAGIKLNNDHAYPPTW